MDSLCNSFLAIKFTIAPTQTKSKQEWVRIRDSPLPHIKQLAKINNDDFYNALKTLLQGGTYAVGDNLYKLFNE